MKTKYLNGIKGIAALGVFTHHFCLAFYPSIHYGTKELVKLPFNIELKFSNSCLSVLLNGNFFVCLFIMISSFIITNKLLYLYKEDKLTCNEIFNIFVRRYLSICIPVFLCSIIVYLLFKFNLFYNISVSNEYTMSPWLIQFYKEPLSLKGLLINSFWGVPFSGDYSFNTAFWMLSYIVWGCFIGFINAMMISKWSSKALIPLMLLSFLSINSQSYYSAIFFGSILCCLPSLKYQSIAIIILLFGLFIGGYPTSTIPNNYYSVFNVMSNFGLNKSLTLHILGSFLILYGCMNSTRIRKVLESKLFTILGKYNFSIYLFHIPILFSVGMITFKITYLFLESYSLATFLVYILTLVLLFIVGYIYNVFIEDKMLRQIKNIFR